MEIENQLWGPHTSRGSYFYQMLHCGPDYNLLIERILRRYLPAEILDENKDKLAFYSTVNVDGMRLSRDICESREIILISEHICPKDHLFPEDDKEVRYFGFVVLHEVAHAILRHKTQRFDGITDEEDTAQEEEADALALKWYNDFVKENNNSYLPELTVHEVQEMEQKSRDQPGRLA